MHNPPLSSGLMAPGYSITGVHVHPKAKSNDMMMGINVKQQAKIAPGQQINTT
jgi:hypothetical protein